MTDKTLTLEEYAKRFWPASRIVMIQQEQREYNAILQDFVDMIEPTEPRLNFPLMILGCQISCARRRMGFFRRWFEWLVGLGDE